MDNNDTRVSKGNLDLQKIQAEMWKILVHLLLRIPPNAQQPAIVLAPSDLSNKTEKRIEKLESRLENLAREEEKLQRKFDHVALQRLSKLR